MTKDLSYSYVTLMPKDEREADIYFDFKIKEVSELYAYYLALICLVIIAEALEFNSQRTLFSFFVLLSSLAMLTIRFVSHCLRRRFPITYNSHLLILHIFGQIRFAVVAYIKLTRVDESMQKEMAEVLYKNAQEQLTMNALVQVIFLSPTFGSCVMTMVSLFLIKSCLV